MPKRRKKAKTPPTRELTFELPGLVAIRLEEIRSLIGAASPAVALARLIAFYDRVASSVHLEGAVVEVRHKDGRWEQLRPEEV